VSMKMKSIAHQSSASDWRSLGGYRQ
jgi:hypothetical protein